jgi:hypothetical protein
MNIMILKLLQPFSAHARAMAHAGLLDALRLEVVMVTMVVAGIGT